MNSQAPHSSNMSASSITFFPASHGSAAFHPVPSSLASGDPALNLLRQAYKGKKVPVELLQSSLPRNGGSISVHDIILQSNGFVHTVMEAYNHHRSLIVRPDDVWLAILVQFNFYVNGNAELLRKYFVSHEGKEDLVVIGGPGNRYLTDFAAMSRKMTELMEKNVIDPELRSWVIPTFSTTTLTDTTVYAMVMMAALKGYFQYTFDLWCGIPQVTLEGTKEDWEALLSRLGKLSQYGKEADSWYHLLRPIISQFVAAYDEPNRRMNRRFWSKVATIEVEGSGSECLAGWITAFCYFRPDGSRTETSGQGISLNGVRYPRISTDKIPGGCAEVDVLLDDNGAKFNTTIVAGSIGTQICPDENSVRNTVRPLSAWWYFSTGRSKK